MFTQRANLVVVLVAGFLLGGCGSGEEDGPTAPTPTKAAFLQKGNAICAAASARINRQFEGYSRAHLTGGRSVSDIAYARAMAGIVLPAVREEVREISRLRAPAGGGQKVSEILAAFEVGVAEGERDPLTLPGTHGSYAFERAHRLASAYGLTRCALG